MILRVLKYSLHVVVKSFAPWPFLACVIRSYITFDILRRVLSDYFNYEIVYVMNITDIDDKIIRRARWNYLLDNYNNEEHGLGDMVGDVTDALKVRIYKFCETPIIIHYMVHLAFPRED